MSHREEPASGSVIPQSTTFQENTHHTTQRRVSSKSSFLHCVTHNACQSSDTAKCSSCLQRWAVNGRKTAWWICRSGPLHELWAPALQAKVASSLDKWTSSSVLTWLQTLMYFYIIYMNNNAYLSVLPSAFKDSRSLFAIRTQTVQAHWNFCVGSQSSVSLKEKRDF